MLDYIEPVFRPPSEARSLILQVTNGCSYNKCTFCDMYTAEQKKFKAKSSEELTEDILQAAKYMPDVQRVFLADGDAMVLPSRRLIEILELIRQHLPQVRRVSAYCLPRNLRKKKVEDLKVMAQLGLSLVYVGAESGDDEVLELIDKGETYETTRLALDMLASAGIKRSVMILNGLGGSSLSEQHIRNSARLMNETQPEYLSTLVVSFPLGDARFRSRFESFVPLNQRELLIEMQLLLETLELDQTIFRSDHASNYLALKGVLGRDKPRLLAQMAQALDHQIPLRQEWQRGL